MYTEEFQNLDNTAEKADVLHIIQSLLTCNDAKYIDEIYAQKESISNNEFTNYIYLMIEIAEGFKNTDLYDIMDEIDEDFHPFTLIVSVEPNTAERGHGIILWKRR